MATGNWQVATGNWQLATGNWLLTFQLMEPIERTLFERGRFGRDVRLPDSFDVRHALIERQDELAKVPYLIPEERVVLIHSVIHPICPQAPGATARQSG